MTQAVLVYVLDKLPSEISDFAAVIRGLGVVNKYEQNQSFALVVLAGKSSLKELDLNDAVVCHFNDRGVNVLSFCRVEAQGVF